VKPTGVIPFSVLIGAINPKMRIGLISDTHIWGPHIFPNQIREVFSGVDFILHAGDIYETTVLDELECIAPVMAAKGDDDHFSLPDVRVKDAHFMTIDGLTLWLKHRMPFGVVWALNQGEGSELVDMIKSECAVVPDIVVFGDTHRGLIRKSEGILFVNPGSPTLPDYVSKAGTVALLTTASGEAEAHLIQLD
jgi:putative phosphoesterase